MRRFSKLILLILETRIYLEIADMEIAEMDYSAVVRLSDKNYRDLKRLRESSIQSFSDKELNT